MIVIILQDFFVITTPIGLDHPLDGITNPTHKLLFFLTTKKFFAKTRRLQLFTGIGAATYRSVYG
jgi:hypothetical protein